VWVCVGGGGGAHGGKSGKPGDGGKGGKPGDGAKGGKLGDAGSWPQGACGLPGGAAVTAGGAGDLPCDDVREEEGFAPKYQHGRPDRDGDCSRPRQWRIARAPRRGG